MDALQFFNIAFPLAMLAWVFWKQPRLFDWMMSGALNMYGPVFVAMGAWGAWAWWYVSRHPLDAIGPAEGATLCWSVLALFVAMGIADAATAQGRYAWYRSLVADTAVDESRLAGFMPAMLADVRRQLRPGETLCGYYWLSGLPTTSAPFAIASEVTLWLSGPVLCVYVTAMGASEGRAAHLKLWLLMPLLVMALLLLRRRAALTTMSVAWFLSAPAVLWWIGEGMVPGWAAAGMAVFGAGAFLCEGARRGTGNAVFATDRRYLTYRLFARARFRLVDTTGELAWRVNLREVAFRPFETAVARAPLPPGEGRLARRSCLVAYAAMALATTFLVADALFSLPPVWRHFEWSLPAWIAGDTAAAVRHADRIREGWPRSLSTAGVRAGLLVSEGRYAQAEELAWRTLAASRELQHDSDRARGLASGWALYTLRAVRERRAALGPESAAKLTGGNDLELRDRLRLIGWLLGGQTVAGDRAAEALGHLARLARAHPGDAGLEALRARALATLVRTVGELHDKRPLVAASGRLTPGQLARDSVGCYLRAIAACEPGSAPATSASSGPARPVRTVIEPAGALDAGLLKEGLFSLVIDVRDTKGLKALVERFGLEWIRGALRPFALDVAESVLKSDRRESARRLLKRLTEPDASVGDSEAAALEVRRRELLAM
ncbi:MAG: hypothetical protein HY816_01545 [Candidatus Wallbacteria bacterium]|nr:hypothetical protein [Candidatus Wallbacteria bacterium]